MTVHVGDKAGRAAELLLAIRAVACDPPGVDVPKLNSFVNERREILWLMAVSVRDQAFDAVAGGALGAWMAELVGLPLIQVRDRIEGELKPGQKVLLVEDLAALPALRAAGAICEHAAVVIHDGKDVEGLALAPPDGRRRALQDVLPGADQGRPRGARPRKIGGFSMCCFSRHVDAVSGTNIFARGQRGGLQVLVYSMTLSSKEDVAMILPLPVPANCPEDALKWISFKEYPDFFKDLHRGFPAPAEDPPLLSKSEPKPRALAVVEVGDFEASFVPSEKDFERLDERFRLPSTPPAAKGFGFAVFKLKKGARTVHPMAFDFPRANPARLFFPTLHIHDGKVHDTAAFDHALFAQNREGERLEIQDWRESGQPASAFVKIAKAQGVVDGERHVYLREIRGKRKNEDVVV